MGSEDSVAARWREVSQRRFVRPDGTFVGDFEAMYRECDDPWLQTADAARSPFKRIILMRLADLAERRVLDIGCGSGAFTELMRTEAQADVLGVDVSPTAIAQARARYPKCGFEFALATDIGRFGDRRFTAVCMCGLTWCILDSFTRVLQTLKTHFAGALLFHTLSFYAPGKQKYGTEHFTNLKELLSYFSAMTVLETFEHRVYAGDESANTLVIARI